MPKNLAARGLKKESSSKEHHAAKPDRQEGHDKGYSAKNLDQQGGRDDGASDYQQMMRGIKMEQGSKPKSGCFPKLSMMLLPFITVGAYLFLRS